MKNIIRKLICYSFLGIASVLCFNADARVTKEVAEAALPYLMEFAKIPEDKEGDVVQANEKKYTKEKIQAILDMIYTDKGQQQMVNWVQKGEFPELLKDGGFFTENLYSDGWLRIPLRQANTQAQNIDTLTQNLIANVQINPILSFAIHVIRDSYIGALFPCGPGTFSCFAAHQSRLGNHALTNGQLEATCSALLTGKDVGKLKVECQSIIKRLRSLSGAIDNKIISVIFVLNICESAQQVFSILGKQLVIEGNKYNEYICRPVSATAAETSKPREGDCVETLFKHIIAIAIQQDQNKYRTETIPENLKRFFQKGVSGVMDLKLHKEWKDALIDAFSRSKLNEKNVKISLQKTISSLDFQKKELANTKVDNIINTKLDKVIRQNKEETAQKISKGSVQNIVDVLEAIAFYNCNIRDITAEHEANKGQRLANALDQLAGCKNFSVEIVNNQRETSDKDIPTGVDSLIKIMDSRFSRLITIGVWGKEGHAEIISIEHPFMELKPGFLLGGATP